MVQGKDAEIKSEISFHLATMVLRFGKRVGDGGHIGAPKHKMEPSTMAQNPRQSLITSSFDDVGVLQKKLVPFTTELNMHLA